MNICIDEHIRGQGSAHMHGDAVSDIGHQNLTQGQRDNGNIRSRVDQNLPDLQPFANRNGE